MRLLLGGLIAIILLGLYEYAVYEAIKVVMCLGTAGCTAYTAEDFTSGYSHALNGIGGLVSALVVTELALTEPGKAPAARTIGGDNASPLLSWTVTIVAVLYCLVWVVAGLAAYVIGTMWYPGKLQPLTDMGLSWLGIAIAAAYAYLGVSPPQNNAAGNPSPVVPKTAGP